jgi:phosphate transport system protein
MRLDFAENMKRLREKTLEMGGLAEELLAQSVVALKNQDLELARQVMMRDDDLDKMELEIEDRCINLLALQHPLASDLRMVTAVLKVATDLERLGDQACNVAEIALRIGNEELVKPLEDIPRLADMVQSMVRESLDAFVNKDILKAREVCAKDDEVDKLYYQLHQELMDYMVHCKEASNVQQAANLLFVARFLERIGDHSTNIGERVIYLVTGKRETY